MQQENARFSRYKNPLAVLLIDVDNFKQFNDKHGHAAGDQALQHVSTLLLENTRITDTVGRYSGEEFVMVLVGTDAIGASNVAHRILSSIENEPLELNGHAAPLTLSVGISALCTDCEQIDDPETLIQKAYKALGTSKVNGQNPVTIYDQDLAVKGTDPHQAAQQQAAAG